MISKEKVLDLFGRVLEMENVPETISQQNCEAWDSMNQLNLVLELEEEFDVRFEPEDIAEMVSFEKVMEYLNSKKK